jgi:hypothetical protein
MASGREKNKTQALEVKKKKNFVYEKKILQHRMEVIVTGKYFGRE